MYKFFVNLLSWVGVFFSGADQEKSEKVVEQVNVEHFVSDSNEVKFLNLSLKQREQLGILSGDELV